MDPLSIAASIAGLLTITGAIISKGYAHISEAKKQDGDLKTLLNEVAAFAGILVGVRGVIEEAGGGDAVEQQLLDSMAGRENNRWEDIIAVCETMLGRVRELVEERIGAGKVKIVVKGPSMAARVEKLIAGVERCKGLFCLWLQVRGRMDGRNTAKLTAEVLEMVKIVVEKQYLLIRKVDARDQDANFDGGLAEMRDKIINWLGPTSEAFHNDIVRDRDPNSCQWLLNRPEFLNWVDSDGFSSFWLWGIQGSGKTVIVSKVIETIEECFLEAADVVVYHYCRFSDSVALSSERVLGAIVAQLLSKVSEDIPIPTRLEKLLARYRSRSYPRIEELREVFHELHQYCSRVFVIIDGLDEVNDRAGILEFLIDLQVVGGVYKVFVASRPEIDLEDNFKSYLKVPITQEDVQTDMEMHVLKQFQKLGIGDDGETSKETIAAELVERAEGMFLWTICQIDHLSRIRTAITPNVLTALPRGLQNTFEDILAQLEEDDQALALKILRVVMFSKRALDLGELVEAVAITTDTQSLKKLRSNMLRRPNDVFQLCGSLIRQSPTTGKISLSHYSVKEFLSLPTWGKGRPNPFYIEATSSQTMQFVNCISYLSMDDFVSETFRETLRVALDPLYGDSDLQAMANFPFLDYASNYWAAHLKSLDMDDFTTIWPLLEIFVDSNEEGSFESWIMISQYNHGAHKFPLGAKPVHVAALYGLEVMLTRLLNADRSISMKQTCDGRTPLHIALENGQEGAIDLLLEATEKDGFITRDLLDIRDQIGRTPLHIAIESGSEVAVVKLVTAGADVNAIQPDGRTAISVAVENRWDLLADFLSRMADPSKILPDGRSLLHIAAESGSLAWVHALLQLHKDRLIDTRDGNGWTPLHYAVDREHLDIAQALIDQECLIEAFDKNGWTPLHAAVRRRNLLCTELLLSKACPCGEPSRTDTSAQPSSSRVSPPDDPLSDSSSDDSPQDSLPTISQRLRMRMSSRTPAEPIPRPSLSGKYGDEARRYRPENSLDRSPSPPPSRRRLSPTSPLLSQPSPLYLAVSESYVEGIELLIKHHDKLSRFGSNVTEEMRCLTTAIDMAKNSGNTDIVLMLMRNLPKLRFKKVFLSLVALPSDAVREHLKTVFTSSDVYSIYIPAAAHMESLIPTLINTWPDVDITSVHSAIHKRLGMAKIFIENNVSISKVLMEECPDSLLHRCIRESNADLELAMYLIERGADVNKRNADGESPLLIISGHQSTSSDGTRQQACLKVAQLLVTKGADIHVLDERQRGLCHRAAAEGNVQLLEWALQTLKLNPSSQDKNSRTPLLLAVENGQTNSVQLLLRQLLSVEEGSKINPYEQTVGAMEYANMRAAPLLRAMVARSTRNFFIVTALVEADEQAFRNLSPERQLDLSDLRTSFYLEALTWSIDCDFFSAFTLLLPRIRKTTLASRANLDGDGIFHVVAAAKHNDFLKTLLQTLDDGNLNDCRAMRLTNPMGKMPMDVVLESGSMEKFILMMLHHVKLTQDQLTKARGRGFNVAESVVG